MALSPNYGWAEPDNSSLVKNGAQDIRALGDAIDTSVWNVGYGQAGKNKLINGNYDIWQRGATFAAAAAGAYTADRFSIQLGGTSINPTVSREATVPNAQSKYSAKVTQVSSNATSVTTYALRQSIEASNLYSLIGKSVTVSFWYRSNKTGSHGIRIYGAFLTGGTDDRQGFTVNVADTWEKKTITSTAFAAVSTINVSPEASGGLIDIGFRVQDAGFSSVNASDYFQISQVQLEVGSKATFFQTASGGSPQAELAACQRYYFRQNPSGSINIRGQGIGVGASSAKIACILPVTMRILPSAVDFSTLGINDTSTTQAVTAITIAGSSSPNIAVLDCTVASGLTQFRPYFLVDNSSFSAFLGFTAEL
jgi:hypothetical protein